MDKFNRTATPRERNIAGYSSLAMGAFIIAVSLGMYPKALEAQHAPLWVVFAAGALFALAGVSILSRDRAPPLLSELLMNVLWTLFAVIGAWAAWGSGKGEIHGSGVSLGWLIHFDGQALGRFMFAAGAILVTTIAAASWWRWFAKLGWRATAGIVVALALAAGALAKFVPAEPLWIDVHDDHARLARYALLSEQERWYQRRPGATAEWYFPYWRNFEHWIRAARGRLSAARVAPTDATVRAVPMTGNSPIIDGKIGAAEWQGALRIALEPEAGGGSVLLMSDGERLYLAADVPTSSAQTVYGRFSFRFHLELSPWLMDERVVVKSDGKLETMRTIGRPQQSGRPKWRTDRNVFERARGAATVAEHRQYELNLDLGEAGIKPGVPFTARLEIEGDPVPIENKRYGAAPMLGRADGPGPPLWLRVDGPRAM
jgi:hypothetical protein